MKSEQSIPELETSFHYHVLLDHASPFPEEKEEETSKYRLAEEPEPHTFYLFEPSSSYSAFYYWCIFFGICFCVLLGVGIVFLWI